MDINQEQLIDQLNQLLAVCTASQHGLRHAAENTDNEQYAEIFREYSNQRMQFIAELENTLQLFGKTPHAPKASLSDALQRVVMGGNTRAILDTMEREEDGVVSAYQVVLDVTLPPHVYDVVYEQYMRAKTAHERIRALRDAEGK